MCYPLARSLSCDVLSSVDLHDDDYEIYDEDHIDYQILAEKLFGSMNAFLSDRREEISECINATDTTIHTHLLVNTQRRIDIGLFYVVMNEYIEVYDPDGFLSVIHVPGPHRLHEAFFIPLDGILFLKITLGVSVY